MEMQNDLEQSNNSEKENKFGEIILPHTEIYYKAITIKKPVF